MAESTKYMPVNGSSDFKFTTFRTKRSKTFAYIFIAVFVAFTVFLAFNPSPNPSSPWFSNIFSGSTSTTFQANSTTTITSSTGSIRSQFSSIYSYLFASNSSQPNQNSSNSTNSSYSNSSIRSPPTQNQTVFGGINVVKLNQTTIGSNHTTEIVKNATRIGEKSKSKTLELKKENVNGTVNKSDLVKDLMNCNLFDGEWVRDESYPLYKPGSCSLIDEQFNCFVNGRPDKGFQMRKWKPKSCTLPR